MTVQELYRQIGHHLLIDDTPSGYLDNISRQPEFERYPYTMLLEMRSTGQSPVHHPEGSVWNHTMLVVDEAAKRRPSSRDVPVFMWAALLHDIGKPLTTKHKKGKITAYDHDKAGAALSRNFLSALTGDRCFIEKVAALVRFHMHILYVVHDLPFADIREMKRCADIHEVALLGLCDRLGRTGARQAAQEAQVRAFIRQCNEETAGRNTNMAKAGMRRPDPRQPHGTESNRKTHIPKNDAAPVPELQGKAKLTKEKSNPTI